MAMTQSLVDYVLQKGRMDYGEFAPRQGLDPSAPLYNHRKLLAYLFQEDEASAKSPEQRLAKRISDLKIQQIPGQLNYFSEKIHAELSRKQLTLDGELYRMENEWLRKKMPDFYCYYFLKFAYANSYSRMHELFLAEVEHMAKEKDSHTVLTKTIEAREACLVNLRRLVSGLKEVQVEESLHSIKEEEESRKRLRAAKQRSGHKGKDEEGGKSWQNELEVVCLNIAHLRKLTCYVVELIRTWRASVYAISQDPRRYRERVIFYHHEANYLLKILFDSSFIRDSVLSKYVSFSKGFDPFVLRPVVLLQSSQTRNTNEDAFLNLLRPTELDMDKITKALVVLAEEEYDQDQQSRFINERSNYGQLEQRKQFIERRRDSLGLRKNPSAKKVASESADKPKTSTQDKRNLTQQKRKVEFTTDKKSGNTQRELEQVSQQRKLSGKKTKVETSLNRLKQMRAADFKKISPYLSRNQRIEKAQRVIELEHKFKVAQEEYTQEIVRQKGKAVSHQSAGKAEGNQSVNKGQESRIELAGEGVSSRIFNRYIEENLKMMDEANRKAFLYKNQREPQHRSAASLNYNKVRHYDRKQAEYQRNLQKYYPRQDLVSPMKKPSKGTKAIIEISNKGVRANQQIIDFELHNRRGKNVGDILESQQRAKDREQTTRKLQSRETSERQPEMAGTTNLFESEKQGEVLVIRQEPEKLEEIKQFLYKKIKEELMEEMKREAQDKEDDLNNMVEEEKRRKLQEIIDQRKAEEERLKEEAERQRLAHLERERKKLSFEVRVEPVQYAEQNAKEYLNAMTGIDSNTYNSMFTSGKIEQLQERVLGEFFCMFLKGYHADEEASLSVVHFDWQHTLHRRLVIDYIVPRQPHLLLSCLHNSLLHVWTHDPAQEVQMIILKDAENVEQCKVVDDLLGYIQQTGQVFEKQLYSQITEYRLVWQRPSQLSGLEFPFPAHYFGQLFNFKAQMLSSSISLSERHSPKVDMTLQVFTDYVLLIQELFRKYLTPEQVVELRENSTNIRRLKDIFRIVLELEKGDPALDQLVVVEGLNLDDLYNKLRDRKMAPYDKYYWHHFYDRVANNRLLLAVLELQPQLKHSLQTCRLEDRPFLRINPRQKILQLKSSVYPEQSIWVLETQTPEVRLFLTGGEHYKLMRMELFVFLNLVFNNIVEDNERYVNSIWIPQIAICDRERPGKRVSRVTDFSISMKKSFFLSEEIYWANHTYIKAGLDLLPAPADLLFRESVIVGMLHTQLERHSTGMPLYAKLIDTADMFAPE